MVSGGKFGTALQAASFQGHENVAEFLLEKGANPNIESKNDTQCGEL
jgi:ankyrin repeat protein